MSRRLLVVEDDPSVRTALERAFRSAGMTVASASTLSEGIAMLAACDVALVDLNLPDGRGTNLLRAIRHARLPVRAAVLSGSLDAETVVAASGERPDAVFRKPVDLATVVAWATGGLRGRIIGES